MPDWTPEDAARHTRRAATPKRARQWAAVANSEYAAAKERGESDEAAEGAAIRAANAAVRRV